MTPHRFQPGRSLWLSLACCLAPAAWAAPQYQANLLQLPAGMFESRVFGIANGLIVGETSDGLNSHATAWTGASGGVVLLQTSPFSSSARAVSGGVIVGWQETIASPTNSEAVRWASTSAAPTVLGAAGGGAAALAVTGAHVAGADLNGAFRHDGIGLTTLAGAPAIAYGISAAGVAVGQSAAGAPTVFNGTSAGDISPSGATSGAAYAILNSQVVGSYDDVNGDQRAFAFDRTTGTSTDLFAGAAFALDASGRVVGADFNAGLAMLYDAGQSYDLNGLVTTGLADYVLTQARGIDTDGAIIAFGRNLMGEERAFLLTLDNVATVPEPASWALMAAGLVWLLTYGRRRAGHD